jgi:hypothetical protein
MSLILDGEGADSDHNIEFKEIRKEWKAKKKEEEAQRKAEDERHRADAQQRHEGGPPGEAPVYGQMRQAVGVPGQGPPHTQLPPIGYQPAASGNNAPQYGTQSPGLPEGMAQYVTLKPNLNHSSHINGSSYPQSPYGQNPQMYQQGH